MILNKEHIQELIQYSWKDEMRHFEEVYDCPLDLEFVNWENKEEVSHFLNMCVKNNWTEHIFYTLAQLKYETL